MKIWPFLIAVVFSFSGLFVYHYWPNIKHQFLLMRVHDLIHEDLMHPGKPNSGKRIELPPNKFGMTSTQLIAGVMVDTRLYYEALNVPMGEKPWGDDAYDHDPGIPDSIFGKCEHCKRSWKWVDGHTTIYNERRDGMFPLCERCWKELIPQARVQYYRALWDRWHSAEPESKWEQIKEAVLEGK